MSQEAPLQMSPSPGESPAAARQFWIGLLRDIGWKVIAQWVQGLLQRLMGLGQVVKLRAVVIPGAGTEKLKRTGNDLQLGARLALLKEKEGSFGQGKFILLSNKTWPFIFQSLLFCD